MKQRNLLEDDKDGLRKFTCQRHGRGCTPTGYIYTADSLTQVPQGLCSSILIIRYCSNTNIKPGITHEMT